MSSSADARHVSLLTFMAESVVILCYTVAINFLAFTYFPRSSCAAYLLAPALPILLHSSIAEGIVMVIQVAPIAAAVLPAALLLLKGELTRKRKY
jgi:hypothetical protein